MRKYEHPISDVHKIFTKYVKAIAYNEKRDYLLELQKLANGDNAYMLFAAALWHEENAVESLCPTSNLEDSLQDEQLARIFRALTATQKCILNRYFYLGLNDAEISVAMRMSRKAVNRHRHNAIRIIRRRLLDEKR